VTRLETRSSIRQYHEDPAGKAGIPEAPGLTLSVIPATIDTEESMLNRYARALCTRAITPIARLLVRAGVSPGGITLLGTVGTCAAALIFYPRGDLFGGTLAITAFIFSDLLDGTMARLSGRSTRWGAFLDSTLDRLGDAAIFGGLVMWFAGDGHDMLLAGLSLFCLVGAAAISYVRARAEGLGMTCTVGIAERGERLVVILTTTGLAGLGVPYIQAGGLWLLAVATVITLLQRIVVVRRQALDGPPTLSGRISVLGLRVKRAVSAAFEPTRI